MNFIDDMLTPQIKKEAMESQGTDKQDHFDRKVVAHPWVNDVLDLDPVTVEAEYREKLKQEAMTLGKTAALDDVIADGVTPEETINRDYKRDVSSLSDYALAEMLAEARGHKAQNTSEMFYELKEKAKSEVASSREKAEKALLDLIPESSMLDWQKAFKEFTKDATPAEAKEKDLFRTDVPEKAHDFQNPTEEKFKLPKDAEKAIPGNGREADERKEVTQEAGVLQKDIVAGTSKEAFLKLFKLVKKAADASGGANTQQYSDMLYTFFEAHPDMAAEMLLERLSPEELFDMAQSLTEMEQDVNNDLAPAGENAPSLQGLASQKKADVGSAPMTTGPDQNDAVIREGFKQMCDGAGEEIILDLLMQYMPVDAMQEMLNDFSDEGVWSPGEEHYEHAGVPMAVSHLKTHALNKKAMGCPVCGQTGKDMKTAAKENVACESCGITYAKASMEIKTRASKEEVIKKVAELSKTAEVNSPWQVVTDEQGNEVVARVDQPTNVKESEEMKPDELLK